ncbi:MAG: alcohol dehydrogenase catalytic domain-containing protein [Candidatus Hydrogenedens sp.]|nr:alcohol dehydrogenase catalytic domain-containing protein [Candidatus Hydrogenedens sp.]
MDWPPTCRAAVFHGPGQPLTQEEIPLPRTLEPGTALVRITMSTICGSDLHTIDGRRTEPSPLILGHEIAGIVAGLGEGLDCDYDDQPLAVGDRVTWSIAASCGDCFYCEHDLPQKCLVLKKYGHTALQEAPQLTGGYAEYAVLFPGTAIFRLPDTLADAVAAPANCALATVAHLYESVGGVQSGECVLVQGAGMLGQYLVPLLLEAGAGSVVVADLNEARLQMAQRFGADHTFNLSGQPVARVLRCVRELTNGRGADVAFEVCGHPGVMAWGVEALRIGGRYGVAGLVTPGAKFELDGNTLTRKCLTLTGVHNYAPRHLHDGLAFLEATHARYPYEALVGAEFSLDEIGAAIDEARSGRHLRVAVRP